MRKILIVVDMQNDFIDGALGTGEAVNILPLVSKRIQEFDGEIYFTRDTHGKDYLSSEEGKNLPVIHCIKGTHGWQINNTLDTSRASDIVDKPTFGSRKLADILIAENEKKKIDSITLIGLCTDICVISNALLLRAALPDAEISVDAACCAGVTPKTHNTALTAMKSCQIKIENENVTNMSAIDGNYAIPKAYKEDTVFYDVRMSPFKIYGLYNPETEPVFRRIPEDVAKEMGYGVPFLHLNTTGGRVRFKTDSPYISIRAVMPRPVVAPHHAMSGSLGFDVYADGLHVRSAFPPVGYEGYAPVFDIDRDFNSLVSFDLPAGEDGMRDITVYMPLYTGIDSMEIGVAPDAVIAEGNEYKYKTPIVFYGSSITHGCAATRPSNSYTAIVANRLDSDFINLGFSGNARGDDAIAEYISALDMSLFVYDYDHNAPTIEHLKKTHKPMFDKIRKANPNLPIIMMSRPDHIKLPDKAERTAVVRATYDAAIADGDKNVYFIDGIELFDNTLRENSTVDGTHPTDIGFASMAERVLKAISDYKIKLK